MKQPNENPITWIGRLNYRNRHERFGMYAQDRLRHLLILGQTGCGKTTIIQTMAKSDFENGAGLMVLDPHGDLVEVLAKAIPKHRKNDLVYFDPADKDKPFLFNPLAETLTGERSLIVSSLLLAFQKTWPDNWGPRSEHLLRMA